MAQLKCINREKTFQASHCIYNSKPPYGISEYLVDIIPPTLNKNQHKVKDSKSFVLQAQTWEIVSYDFTNLYTSIAVDKAIDVILQQLSKDMKPLIL